MRKKNLVLPLMKVRTARGLVKFIQEGLEQNGGDYQVIADRMNTIVEFVKAAKACGVDADFSKVGEAYQDFFVGNQQINTVQFAPDHSCKALYEKPNDKQHSISTQRGVAVVHDRVTQQPMIYFGRRKRWAELQRNDTGILFGATQVIYHDEALANYDEIALWSSGTQAEFDFDHLNRLTSVRYREMAEPRLGQWGPTKEISFERVYFLTKDNQMDSKQIGAERGCKI